MTGQPCIPTMKMPTDKEKAEFIDIHFENFLFVLQAYLGISEKEALKEIEVRINLMSRGITHERYHRWIDMEALNEARTSHSTK